MSLFMRELDSIARCAAQYRAEQLAPLGLKSCHASYLLEICSCPGISQEQLARRTYFSKSSVARQLAVLEEAGFVRRVCSDSDRRVTRLYPTDQAEAAFRKFDGFWASGKLDHSGPDGGRTRRLEENFREAENRAAVRTGQG